VCVRERLLEMGQRRRKLARNEFGTMDRHGLPGFLLHVCDSGQKSTMDEGKIGAVVAFLLL
jgi:hypothetical protein